MRFDKTSLRLKKREILVRAIVGATFGAIIGGIIAINQGVKTPRDFLAVIFPWMGVVSLFVLSIRLWIVVEVLRWGIPGAIIGALVAAMTATGNYQTERLGFGAGAGIFVAGVIGVVLKILTLKNKT